MTDGKQTSNMIGTSLAFPWQWRFTTIISIGEWIFVGISMARFFFGNLIFNGGFSQVA